MITTRSIQRLLTLALGASTTVTCTAPSSVILSVGYLAHGAYADPALFRAEVEQPGRRLSVPPLPLTIRARSATHLQADADGLPIRAGEPVTVRVAIVLANADTAGSGSVTWTPETGWSYGVTAIVSTQRFQGLCTRIAHAIPLPARGGTEGDTLFVLRSGLPRGAVC